MISAEDWYSARGELAPIGNRRQVSNLPHKGKRRLQPARSRR
jgi:hypothetical protein